MDNKKSDLKNTDIFQNSNLQIFSQLSNPLGISEKSNFSALSDYTQTVSRTGYDKDIAEIAEAVRVLNNMAPIKMPEYNFNIERVIGERYYKPDGSLLFIRVIKNDTISDYYYNSNYENINFSVSRILEHDKYTGRLRVKVEPIVKNGSKLNTNIAIFDEKINKKYTIIQLASGGIVSNISEFSGIGKSFRTLFRNIQTYRPVRYIEGKDSKESGFEMTDGIFTANGDVARIKRYNNKREINIKYTSSQKYITVKNKD